MKVMEPCFQKISIKRVRDELIITDGSQTIGIPIEEFDGVFFFPRKNPDGLCATIDETNIHCYVKGECSSVLSTTIANVKAVRESMHRKVWNSIINHMLLIND